MDFENNITFILYDEDNDEVYKNSFNTSIDDSEYEKVKGIHEHRLFVAIDGNEPTEKIKWDFKSGANYQFLIFGNETTVHQITEENKYHIFWQLPQYAIMTSGEVMFSITALEFAFSQVRNRFFYIEKWIFKDMYELFYRTNRIRKK